MFYLTIIFASLLIREAVFTSDCWVEFNHADRGKTRDSECDGHEARNFTLLRDDNNSTSRGILQVNINPPKEPGHYVASLMVVPGDNCNVMDLWTIKQHTLDRIICVSGQAENGTDIQEVKQVGAHSCQGKIRLWYDYVFTGCYKWTLTRKGGGSLPLTFGPEKLISDYKRVEVIEPEYSFQTTRNDGGSFSIHVLEDVTHTKTDNYSHNANKPRMELQLEQVCGDKRKPVGVANCELYDGACSKDATILMADVRTPEGPARLILELSPILAPYKDCLSFALETVQTCSIMGEENTTCRANKNDTTGKCFTTTKMDNNGKTIRNTHCNFEGPSLNEGSCIWIRMIDERCNLATVWNPPHKAGQKPCMWVVHLNGTKKELESKGPDSVTNDLPENVGLPDYVIIILIVGAGVVVGGALLIWKLWIKGPSLPIVPGVVGLKKKGDSEEDSAIVLFYAADTAPFMGLMAAFRAALQRSSRCHVHDMYAANELNTVAKIGGVAWAESRLRSGCRAVWVDTPRARSVILSFSNLNVYIRQQEVFHDFRDAVLPSALDLAKRTPQDTAVQYSSHFVVRFEGLEAMEGSEDPFAVISPHARYLIPLHLTHLCEHLSRQSPITLQEIRAEEAQLRDELKQITCINTKSQYHDT